MFLSFTDRSFCWTISTAMDMLAFYLFFVTFLAHVIALRAQSALPISSRITVVGVVYCDACNDGFSQYSYFMPGVDVNVKCKFNAVAPKTTEMISISVNRSTDSKGVYRLEIPSVDGVDCVDGPPIQSFCQATLLGTSSPACNVLSLKTTTAGTSIKSKQQRQCVYCFTPLSFRPQTRNATLCRHKPHKLPPSAISPIFLLPPNYNP